MINKISIMNRLFLVLSLLFVIAGTTEAQDEPWTLLAENKSEYVINDWQPAYYTELDELRFPLAETDVTSVTLDGQPDAEIFVTYVYDMQSQVVATRLVVNGSIIMVPLVAVDDDGLEILVQDGSAGFEVASGPMGNPDAGGFGPSDMVGLVSVANWITAPAEGLVSDYYASMNPGQPIPADLKFADLVLPEFRSITARNTNVYQAPILEEKTVQIIRFQPTATDEPDVNSEWPEGATLPAGIDENLTYAIAFELITGDSNPTFSGYADPYSSSFFKVVSDGQGGYVQDMDWGEPVKLINVFRNTSGPIGASGIFGGTNVSFSRGQIGEDVFTAPGQFTIDNAFESAFDPFIKTDYVMDVAVALVRVVVMEQGSIQGNMEVVSLHPMTAPPPMQDKWTIAMPSPNDGKFFISSDISLLPDEIPAWNSPIPAMTGGEPIAELGGGNGDGSGGGGSVGDDGGEIWEIYPPGFESTMTMTALITINGTNMGGGALAAFVGNEIRGLQNQPSFPTFGPLADEPMFQITIYTNSTGEDLTFRWSPNGTQTNSILVSSNSSITLNPNANLGSPLDPIILTGTDEGGGGSDGPSWTDSGFVVNDRDGGSEIIWTEGVDYTVEVTSSSNQLVKIGLYVDSGSGSYVPLTASTVKNLTADEAYVITDDNGNDNPDDDVYSLLFPVTGDGGDEANQIDLTSDGTEIQWAFTSGDQQGISYDFSDSLAIQAPEGMYIVLAASEQYGSTTTLYTSRGLIQDVLGYLDEVGDLNGAGLGGIYFKDSDGSDWSHWEISFTAYAIADMSVVDVTLGGADATTINPDQYAAFGGIFVVTFGAPPSAGQWVELKLGDSSHGPPRLVGGSRVAGDGEALEFVFNIDEDALRDLYDGYDYPVKASLYDAESGGSEVSPSPFQARITIDEPEIDFDPLPIGGPVTIGYQSGEPVRIYRKTIEGSVVGSSVSSSEGQYLRLDGLTLEITPINDIQSAGLEDILGLDGEPAFTTVTPERIYWVDPRDRDHLSLGSGMVIPAGSYCYQDGKFIAISDDDYVSKVTEVSVTETEWSELKSQSLVYQGNVEVKIGDVMLPVWYANLSSDENEYDDDGNLIETIISLASGDRLVDNITYAYDASGNRLIPVNGESSDNETGNSIWVTMNGLEISDNEFRDFIRSDEIYLDSGYYNIPQLSLVRYRDVKYPANTKPVVYVDYYGYNEENNDGNLIVLDSGHSLLPGEYILDKGNKLRPVYYSWSRDADMGGYELMDASIRTINNEDLLIFENDDLELVYEENGTYTSSDGKELPVFSIEEDITLASGEEIKSNQRYALDDDGGQLIPVVTDYVNNENRHLGVPSSEIEISGEEFDLYMSSGTIESYGLYVPDEHIASIDLRRGNNMITIPLNPSTPFTAKSLSQHLSGNPHNTTDGKELDTVDNTNTPAVSWVIRYDPTQQQFDAYVWDGDEAGFGIRGGEGYIVNLTSIPEGAKRSVNFTGHGWSGLLNDFTPPEPTVEKAPSSVVSANTWAFVIEGNLTEQMVKSGEGYVLKATNLTSGKSLAEIKSKGHNFRLPLVDMSRQDIVAAGDLVKVELISDNGKRIADTEFTAGQQEIATAYRLVKMEYNPVPDLTRLLQNYPNPFNPETWIPFELSQDAEVSITIYDVGGLLVRNLEVGFQPAGIYSSRDKAIYWDGKTETGEAVASGIYFYNIKLGDYSETRRMVILK